MANDLAARPAPVPARPLRLALALDECHRCGGGGVRRVGLIKEGADLHWRRFAFCLRCICDAASTAGWRILWPSG